MQNQFSTSHTIGNSDSTKLISMISSNCSKLEIMQVMLARQCHQESEDSLLERHLMISIRILIALSRALPSKRIKMEMSFHSYFLTTSALQTLTQVGMCQLSRKQRNCFNDLSRQLQIYRPKLKRQRPSTNKQDWNRKRLDNYKDRKSKVKQHQARS